MGEGKLYLIKKRHC